MAVNWNLLQGGGPASRSLGSVLGGYEAGVNVRQQKEQEQEGQELDQVAMRLEQKMRDPSFELDSSPLFGRLMSERPEVAEAYATRHASMQGRQLDSYIQDMTAVRSALQRGDQNEAYNILGDRIEMLESQGRDDTDSVRALRILEEEGPEAMLQGLDQMVAARQGTYTPMQAQEGPSYEQADFGAAFNPQTGRYSVDPNMAAYLQKMAQLKEEGKEIPFDDKRKIAGEVTKFTEDANKIAGTARDLTSLSENAQGSDAVAAVFQFMKSLDPNSVVREGEFATAENMSGVPGSIRNTYNKIVDGNRLSPEDYKNMIRTAETLANNAIDSARDNVSGYFRGFGDTFSEDFQKNQLSRLPKRFEITPVENPQEAPEPEPEQSGGVMGDMRRQSEGGKVGRFNIIEVN